MPRRRKNSELRAREYVTPAEFTRLLTAATKGRHGRRDRTLVLVMYRHALRVSEAVSLRWDAVHFGREAALAVSRAKHGKSTTHPMEPDVMRSLGELRKVSPDSVYVFLSERGTPMTTSNVRKLMTRIGRDAKLGFPMHPHMLRHGCGYALANKKGVTTRDLQAYLGHRSISSTVIYTELAPGRFKNIWRD
jgi:type 1 fimbriae regulatory protein FimB/type 1 fimbriae regulatory protein FimE